MRADAKSVTITVDALWVRDLGRVASARTLVALGAGRVLSEAAAIFVAPGDQMEERVEEAPTVPYPKAMEKFPTLSQSMLSSFDRCPLSARFDMEAGKTTSHPLARGRVFHATAAKCLEEMARHGEDKIEVDVALAILEEAIRMSDVDRYCYRCGTETEPRVGEDGQARFYCSGCDKERESEMDALPLEEIRDLRMSVIKWAHDNTFTIENLAGVELALSAEIGYPSDLGMVVRELTGKVDALFFEGDRAIVPDWKDSWALPGPTSVSFTGYFQQRFYGFLVFRNFPAVKSVTLREVYHRFNERREVTLQRDDLADVESELSALVERFDRAVEQSIWKAAPGKHCSYCARPEACPIFPSARGEGAISSASMARRYAAEATVAKAVLKQRMDALKAYSNRHGDVPVKDDKGKTVFGFVETTSTTRPDKRELEAELIRNGAKNIDLDKLYKVRKGTTFKQHAPPSGPRPADAKMEEMLRLALDKQEEKKDE